MFSHSTCAFTLCSLKYAVLRIRLHVQFGQSIKHGNHDSGVLAELPSATKVSWKYFL